MLKRLRAMRDEARSIVSSFEPGRFSGKDAAELVEAFCEIERIITAGKLKAAVRAEDARVHEEDGHTRAGSWLAGITGEPVGTAIGSLETMRSAIKHPAVAEAFSNGEISVAQARQIASAADAFPDEAPALIDAAVEMSFDELKKRCDEVRFASRSTDEEIDRHERIRRSRSCRTWVDHQGAGRLEAKMTSDALAVLRQCLGHFERQVLKDNPDRDEPKVAYAADALVAMAEASILSTGSERLPGPNDRPGKHRTTAIKPLVRIRVDLEALKRGHTTAGETCSIPGIGPVPVEIARSVLGEALLELVITSGTDVSTVVTDSRTIRKALKVALDERDGVCCVPGCAVADHLETDHYDTDFAKGGWTEISNLARLCTWHHYNKTHKGWRLQGRPGHWRFVAPDDGRRREPPRRDALF